MTPDQQSTVLVINSGSSSVKFQLVDGADGHVHASGLVERIGQDTGTGRIDAEGREARVETAVADHTAAMEVIAALFSEVGLDLGEAGIAVVGHRVVQGGDRYAAPQLIDESVREGIREFGALAPLHNYAALAGIDGARALLPDLPQVAVFDTAFFTDLPAAASTYAIDRTVAAEHAIRRYGAHGTSHRYVSEQVPALVGAAPATLRQIVLHLGNGASASAIRGGVPVDTSMGLTPLQGLVMGTRSGDIDPSVYVHLHRTAQLTPEEVDDLLNKRSGMLGLCGMSDFRDIEAAIEAGDEDAALAMEVYTHRLRSYIGSYAFALGGVDVITFTAGIGENSPGVRARALAGLEAFGIVLDAERNAERSRHARVISADTSAVTVLVVPTDEERAIAQLALGVVRD